jgi:low temperature requirement protein LtrA
MTGSETLVIMGGAICLSFPLWGAYLFQTWLDRRPTPEQRAARTRELVQRRRDQITRRGW